MPSDISRKQFEIIKEDLKSVWKTTCLSTYNLYDIFCAVIYLLEEGCTWRAIPYDFPKLTTIWYHYDIWIEKDENGISILDKILHKLIEVERKENGHEEKITMIIADSRSVQKYWYRYIFNGYNTKSIIFDIYHKNCK
ncbi:MAG: transposase [Ruminococcus sp.]|nr:transposase [Ruminococcus sp.]